MTRRDALRSAVALAALEVPRAAIGSGRPRGLEPRPHIEIRGIYGGFPTMLTENGRALSESGVNAVWIGSGTLKRDHVEQARAQGARLFAEFNSMHVAAFIKEHPDAAPVGKDGLPCPAPEGWQGVCPSHPGYRADRMAAFRRTLTEFEIDGIWLDYHHSHASWERAEPLMPETCFCSRCLNQFTSQTGIVIPGDTPVSRSSGLLTERLAAWVSWRCGVFTDWVREYRAIRDEARPKALLGTFHCPWSDTDYEGALRGKLAIDLKAQAPMLDVLSPMPYHARFGHADDPGWISRQTRWLGEFLGLQGRADERLAIWPIVQLSDWGERVPSEQVEAVLDHGTRAPSRGVTIFGWGGLRDDPAKLRGVSDAYRAIAGL